MSARFAPALVVATVVALGACVDRAQPLEPEQDILASPVADVTTKELVTNTLEFVGRCANSVTGSLTVVVERSEPFNVVLIRPCPAWTETFSAENVTGVRADYKLLSVDPLCNQISEVHPVEDFPSRSKCTVNGTDANGKQLATVTMRYVKD